MPTCPTCAGFTERFTFSSPEKYRDFIRQLIDAVKQGKLLLQHADHPLDEMLTDPWPGGDIISHDFQCMRCGRGFELFVNVWNGRNGWEPAVEAPEPTPLSVFRTGQITVMAAHVMKVKLEELVVSGLVEELPLPEILTSSKRGTERWFRDTMSNVTYRLIEYFGFLDADDIRWEVVPPAEQSGRLQ